MVFGGIGAIFLAVPAGIVATIFLHPFWSWLETTAGVECVGHSGPAAWCYVVMVIASAALLVLLTQLFVRRSGPGKT